ncbi:hypothetical protein [Bosea sp. (in: a-proteobacteria)]|jgi:hypothetical protein|uniref:hypothetical protein n=1 Tax=Bosea sp. (in: a-proteobacteria) TaxID=1871050 RepID=UPI003F72D6F9
MRRALVLTLAVLLGCGPLAFAAERMTGEEIRQAFEGNTVSGRYNSGQPFSEYHHADGRASGHNRHLPNRDACWTTTPDSVCYYYGPPERRRTYCFSVERSGKLHVLRSRATGRINGVATIEPGDPHGFAASAGHWTCDGLISQGFGSQPRLAAR